MGEKKKGPLDNYSVRVATVEKVKVGIMQAMPEGIIGDPFVDVKVISDFIKDTMMVQLQGFVLGHNHVDKYEILTYPTWWDMYKATAMPKWLRKICKPAKVIKKVIDVKILYPELHKKIALPNENHRIDLTEMDIPVEEGKDENQA